MIQSLSRTGPLKGVALGISASDNPESLERGYSMREVNRSVRIVAQAVLGQGGRVVFGQDWRPNGIMADILMFAIGYQLPPRIEGQRAPLITNCVPWPSKTTLSKPEQEQYKNILKIDEMGKPELMEISHLDLWDYGSDGQRIMRVEALTQMRKHLIKTSTARLCMGGRTSGSGGRCAGIIEEAALAFQAEQPLYVTKLFGGASAQLIDAIEGRHTKELEAFRPRDDILKSFRKLNVEFQQAVHPSIFTETNVEKLSLMNHLSVIDNRRLFAAQNLSDVISLMLKGIKASLVRTHV